jgi:hypothetical protein
MDHIAICAIAKSDVWENQSMKTAAKKGASKGSAKKAASKAGAKKKK